MGPISKDRGAAHALLSYACVLILLLLIETFSSVCVMLTIGKSLVASLPSLPRETFISEGNMDSAFGLTMCVCQKMTLPE